MHTQPSVRTSLPLAFVALVLAGPLAAADDANEAAALTSRVAAGRLAPDRLEVAALLGHEPAKLALGRAPKKAALGRCGHEASVRLALSATKAAGKRWGGEPPEPVVRAIAALDAWVGCPCAEHAATCGKLEEEVRTFTSTLFDVDTEAPDADARLDEMQRRSQVALAASLALLTVRAPMEQGESTPAPAPEIALDVVGQAGGADSMLHHAEAPQPTDAAARLLGQALAGGGHGRPSPETVEAGRADLQRWQQECAVFERAAQERVLVDVRADYLPWLLAGG